MRRSGTVLLLTLLSSCGSSEPPTGAAVTFVHATDPHLFEDTTENRDRTPERAAIRRQWQGTQNGEALAALMVEMKALAGGPDAPSFLVITGDFGVDYSWGAPDTAGRPAEQQKRREVRAQQADTAAALLSASPVRDIYVVPGNNDIGGESPDTLAAAAPGRFFDSVQTRLRKIGTGVVLHNLAGCYSSDNSPASACAADLPGTDLRLLGFASYSFKNADSTYRTDSAARNSTNARQERQVARFEAMVVQAADAGKRVLVLSHIPWLDDPYSKARGQFAADTELGFGTPQRQWSTWNVSPKVLEGWKHAVGSPAVLAVLAGHFHDSHREIYAPPYAWSSTSASLPPPEKLLVAPPLAVRLQETSPIQARGFAVIRVAADTVKRKLYWFDAGSHTFRPEASAPAPGPSASSSWPALVLAIWGLGGNITDLNRAALLAVAFIAALLTVIYIWKIGEVRSELTAAASTAKDKTDATAGGGATAGAVSGSEPAPDGDSPFTNRIGKAVLAGFGGLAVITVLSDLAGDKNAKAFYVVLFVSLFVALLLVAAFSQALVEALRSRVVVASPLPVGADDDKRFFTWIGSWRTTLLVFLDNAVNVILGRNRLESTLLADEIYRLQWALVGIAERVRVELTRAVQRALAKECPEQCLDETAFRVGISVFQPRRGTLRYVARSRLSLQKEFPEKTVAWVAAFYGAARWWKRSYMNKGVAEQIVLWPPPGSDGEQRLLKNYFEIRERSDYEAFIVLPVPWGRRGIAPNYQSGAIHISFQREEYFDRLFENLEKVPASVTEPRLPNYDDWLGLLDEPLKPCREGAQQSGGPPQLPPEPLPTEHEAPAKPPQLKPGLDELRAVLRTSIEVLGESLRFYNESVFNHLRPPADLR
jgi:hypothetical protein